MIRTGIVGATGAVGGQMLEILIQRKFPVAQLRVFASEKSIGKPVKFGAQTLSCEGLREGCFRGLDLVFFDASDAVSKEWGPRAVSEGAWVVDHSAAFRMGSDVPLVVPEVNGAQLRAACKKGQPRLIAGPNCSTAQLVMALKPLQNLFGLNRVVVSTYQSVSGAGAQAVREFEAETLGVLGGGPSAKTAVFKHPIALNCIPQIGGFLPDGFTSEEHKLMSETRKILELPSLKVSATAIRVPTRSCHAESVTVELARPATVAQVREALRSFSGVQVLDDPAAAEYPMGVDFVGQDAVGVGRIRKDAVFENGLSFWVVSDNLRKGAALNAIQIGELLQECVLGG